MAHATRGALLLKTAPKRYPMRVRALGAPGGLFMDRRHRVVAALWIGMCAIALAGCSSSDDSKDGEFVGSCTRTRTIYTSGASKGFTLPPETSAGCAWDVVGCKDGLAVTTLAGCVVWSAPDANRQKLAPGYWCELTSAKGPERYTVLDGSFEIADGKLSGKIHYSRSWIDAGVAYYEEFTDEASGLSRAGAPPKTTTCAAASNARPAPDDYSALAGCVTLAVRTDPAADRTVTIATPIEPKCMRVAPGQTVVFQGPWTLVTGTPTDPNAGSAANPIPNVLPSGTTRVEVTFPRLGDYLYYATDTHQQGMIRVR